jgi:hypothetical protein
MKKTALVIARALHHDERSVDRFWSRVVPDPAPPGCWEWNGHVRGARYPTFFIGSHTISAARVAWFLATGELPIGGRLLHRCENERCVRPTHMIWAIGWRTNRSRTAAGEGYLSTPAPLMVAETVDAPSTRRFVVANDPSIPVVADPALETRCA